MKIEITDLEVCHFLSSLTIDEIESFDENFYSSIPITGGEWRIPDNAVEKMRVIVSNFTDKTIWEKMEAQTIRGTLHIDFGKIFLDE